MRFPNKTISPGEKQQGFVMIIVAIGAIVMTGMVGLALDFGHVATNRARLQNSLDAAALGAARALQLNPIQADAIDAGRLMFSNNINAAENNDLITGGASENDLVFEFSATVKPFVPDAAATDFVRVSMSSNLTYATWFISIFGQSNLSVNSSAVAGTSPVLGMMCNLAPFVVCADTTQADLGYPVGKIITIKVGDMNDELGYGNFQLISIDGDNSSGKEVKETLAGNFENCIDKGGEVITKPGNTTGPAWQGFNTRFGITGTGGMDPVENPPDKVTDPMLYAEYLVRYNNKDWNFPDGIENRRVMSVPVADCSGTNNGLTTLPIIKTICIFLTQPAGAANDAGDIFAEVIDGCFIQGIPGPDPSESDGPTTIQLYGDADRWDT
jgi:Flp pilus assembly protein TadG